MFRFALIDTLFCLPLFGAVGCSSPAPAGEPYATFQACWDEHHTTENFSVQRAIEICCIDHPIGGAAMNTVCGATAMTCETYVTANLATTVETPAMLQADIMTACSDYVVDRGG